MRREPTKLFSKWRQWCGLSLSVLRRLVFFCRETFKQSEFYVCSGWRRAPRQVCRCRGGDILANTGEVRWGEMRAVYTGNRVSTLNESLSVHARCDAMTWLGDGANNWWVIRAKLAACYTAWLISTGQIDWDLIFTHAPDRSFALPLPSWTSAPLVRVYIYIFYNYNNTNNNNKQICIAPLGRNFRGAGAIQRVSEQRKDSPGKEECL